jgi:hypothetical protein
MKPILAAVMLVVPRLPAPTLPIDVQQITIFDVHPGPGPIILKVRNRYYEARSGKMPRRAE